MVKRWLPLEANPDVMNQVPHASSAPPAGLRLGLPSSSLTGPRATAGCSSCGGWGSRRTWGSATCTGSTTRCSPWCPSRSSPSSCSTRRIGRRNPMLRPLRQWRPRNPTRKYILQNRLLAMLAEQLVLFMQ
uniref:Uncharacterized protein n=1 Tax=Aegilops tauschii subsp. strangulata TaxID=200361 RepID=A0A453CKZ3_AEGTS